MAEVLLTADCKTAPNQPASNAPMSPAIDPPRHSDVQVSAESMAEPRSAATRAPYQLMPDLTSEEYESLKANIQRNGILVPILVDENGAILDGHHRRQIAAELGIDCPVDRQTGLTEAAKRDVAVALNIERRHLTREQRQSIIDQCLLAAPEKSDRAIAKLTGTSDKTVAVRRRTKEATAEIPQLKARVGGDGKLRKAAQRQGAGAVSPKGPSVPRSVETVMEQFESVCIAIKQLDDGGKLIAQDAFRIAGRAKSLLSYTLGKLLDADRARLVGNLNVLIAKHGGAA